MGKGLQMKLRVTFFEIKKIESSCFGFDFIAFIKFYYGMFGNIIVVTFQNIFYAEMIKIMFFLFKKNYFSDQYIKTIQNIKKLIFNKK